ncbi:hypothetical protein GCM10009764_62200 [Nocardia ninae]|uniref:Uncharacterized protein n=1 Tax=Nocardia ninae NBRC 108245 TaxID=1210091 RepID=A0A511M8A5_9NOCA|nr:hypothetical protein NN4_13690 [Nocardia ninae NBRC 108245]
MGGAGSASAATAPQTCIDAWDSGRVIACVFRNEQECRAWVAGSVAAGEGRESAAGCLWNDAGSHLPQWNNKAGYIGGVLYVY